MVRLQGAYYPYYYANLLGKDSSVRNQEARQLREFKGLVGLPDDKLSNTYRKCKARACLGILYYKRKDFTEAVHYLIARLQSGIAQVWLFLARIGFDSQKGVQIAAAISIATQRLRMFLGLAAGR